MRSTVTFLVDHPDNTDALEWFIATVYSGVVQHPGSADIKVTDYAVEVDLPESFFLEIPQCRETNQGVRCSQDGDSIHTHDWNLS